MYCIPGFDSSAIVSQDSIDFLDLFWYIRARSASRASSGMKRKDIKAAIQQRGGIEAALIVPKGTLTSKQRKFAEAIAAGETGAAAYRSAYDTEAKPQVQSHEAHKLKAHPKIAMQIEALRLANEAMAYASAEQVRQLVIQSLIQTLIDPETKAATKVAAAKVLGNVTEVAAFTQRSEVTHIKDSGSIRDQIMAQLKTVILDASDAETVDADRLLSELAGNAGNAGGDQNPDGDGPTGEGDANLTTRSHSRTLHSNPHEQSHQNSDSRIPEQSAPLSFENDNTGDDIFDDVAFMALNTETPPLSSEMEEGGGDIFEENDDVAKR
jgi:hypothetical protein